MKLSGVHAVMRRTPDDGIEVADLGSRYGVWDGYVSCRTQRMIVYPSHLFGLGSADVGRLDHGAERTLGRDRVLANELPACHRHTAEILGPGAIQRGVHH